MKVEFWVIGKTNEKYLEQGIELYQKRLRHYLPFTMIVLPDIRGGGKLTPEQLKSREGEMILSKTGAEDLLILLDERGSQLRSEEFANFMEAKLQAPFRRLIFLVGGAYGFDAAVYQRANEQLALSRMTFSHQMVRLFFLEQLYRAMTILRNEPYHNE